MNSISVPGSGWRPIPADVAQSLRGKKENIDVLIVQQGHANLVDQTMAPYQNAARNAPSSRNTRSSSNVEESEKKTSASKKQRGLKKSRQKSGIYKLAPSALLGKSQQSAIASGSGNAELASRDRAQTSDAQQWKPITLGKGAIFETMELCSRALVEAGPKGGRWKWKLRHAGSGREFRFQCSMGYQGCKARGSVTLNNEGK